MATPITQFRLTEDDLANAKLAIEAGLAKNMTEAVRYGLTLGARAAREQLVAPDVARDCRMCGAPTKNPCGICDRHMVSTAKGFVHHRGTKHNRVTCPFNGKTVALVRRRLGGSRARR